MNVAGSVLHRLEEHQIDEADNRRLVRQPVHQGHIIGGGDFADFLGNFGVGAQFLQDIVDAFAVFRVKFFDGPLDQGGIGNDQLNIFLNDEP